MSTAHTNAQAATGMAGSTTQRVVRIVWPAFLAAGLMEMLVFAFVNPSDLHWGQGLLAIEPAGVYTVAFFAFWAVTAASSGLTVLLVQPFCNDTANVGAGAADGAGTVDGAISVKANGP
jgi:hypothetical protein